MPTLAQLARQGGYYGNNTGTNMYPNSGTTAPWSPTNGTNTNGTYGVNYANNAATNASNTGGLEPMPMGSPFSSNRYGGFNMGGNHNRVGPQSYNPTYGQQTQQVGQAAMAPTIANAQTNAQKAIASAGFMTPGPTGAAAEWQSKYGNYVKNLSGGYAGPDTGNTGVLSQKGAPLFTMISNGLGAGKSVSEMEGILSGLGYVPSPGSPYGWAWGGSGPEPTMAQIYQQANPATQKYNAFTAGDPNANAASLYQP